MHELEIHGMTRRRRLKFNLFLISCSTSYQPSLRSSDNWRRRGFMGRRYGNICARRQVLYAMWSSLVKLLRDSVIGGCDSTSNNAASWSLLSCSSGSSSAVLRVQCQCLCPAQAFKSPKPARPVTLPGTYTYTYPQLMRQPLVPQ